MKRKNDYFARFKDSVFYTKCDCFGDHFMSISVEQDTKFPEKKTITFYNDGHWIDDYFEEGESSPGFFTKLKRRGRVAWQILTTGHAEFSSEFIFQDNEHIDAFIEKLKELREK